MVEEILPRTFHHTCTYIYIKTRMKPRRLLRLKNLKTSRGGPCRITPIAHVPQRDNENQQRLDFFHWFSGFKDDNISRVNPSRCINITSYIAPHLQEQLELSLEKAQEEFWIFPSKPELSSLSVLFSLHEFLSVWISLCMSSSNIALVQGNDIFLSHNRILSLIMFLPLTRLQGNSGPDLQTTFNIIRQHLTEYVSRF